jgi:hypothetical protein
MSRWHLVVACMSGAVVASGCGTEGSENGGRPERESDATDHVVAGVVIDISGTAAIHPSAAAWMTDRRLPLPSLQGFTLRVEEPFRMALQDPNPLLGEAMIETEGAFAVQDVDTARLSFGGIAAGLVDGRGAGTSPIIPSTTVVFDVRLHDSLPQADLTAVKVWAIPVPYHEQLTAAVTPTRIQELTSRQAVSLSQAGFILGRIVDAQGNAVAGASIETDPPTWADRIFYPSEDLLGVTQIGTSANGLFLFVHSAGGIDPFTFRVRERPEYGWRNGGVQGGKALVVTVHPGATPP